MKTFQIYKTKATRAEPKINTYKTKILLVNYQLSNQRPTSLENLEIVDKFKYLGAKAASSNDFKQRRGISWSQFRKLKKVCRSTNISLKLKLHLFDLQGLSIILNGAESWTTTQQLMTKLNAFGTSCDRILFNIRRIDRVTSKDVLGVTLRKHLPEMLLSKQLRVLEHWLRRPPETTIKKYALYIKNEGKILNPICRWNAACSTNFK